jgi:hypothetical protein
LFSHIQTFSVKRSRPETRSRLRYTLFLYGFPVAVVRPLTLCTTELTPYVCCSHNSSENKDRSLKFRQ